MITITRALAELKLLDSRIRKKVDELKPVDVKAHKHGDKCLEANMPREDFEKDAKSTWESIISLIDRRTQLKTAIAISNATTTVKIAGLDMTVAQAIEEKRFMEYKEHLLSKLVKENNHINTAMERSRVNLDKNVQQMLEANLGKDRKSSSSDYEIVAKPFIEMNELHKIDPLKIDEKIKQYREYIDQFKSDIDIALTESNSVTRLSL